MDEPTISRSTGIEVAGWYGPRPGGGYSGATAELDAQVVANAEALREAFGQPVEIRFNSDRRSGGAFLPNDVGINAGFLMTRERWLALCRRYPDEPEWLRSEEPEGDGGQLYVAVYAPMAALVDPGVCSESRYFSEQFAGLQEALDWVRTHMRAPETSAQTEAAT